MSKALALWGGGGLLVVSAGTGAILVSNGAAAPASGSPATTSSTTSSSTSSGSSSAASTAGNRGNGNGGGGGNSGNGGGNGAGTGSPGKAITVTGAASGVLAPGRDDLVTVTITNPNSSDILVTKVTGTVTGVTGAATPTTLPVCDAAWYQLRDFTGSARVLANKSGTVQMVVHFDDRAMNQDRCKGARYTFNFTASANQA